MVLCLRAERCWELKEYRSVITENIMIETIRLDVMEFDQQQLNDLRAAVVYYMQRNISIRNPRYEEYEDILKKLNKTIPTS